MRKVDGAGLITVSGGFALWMGATETALLYVRPATRLWLVIAGSVLVLVGLAIFGLAWRDRHAGPERERGHGARVGWLLALPLVIAIGVGSSPLGSYAAGRQTTQRTLPQGEFDLEQYLNAGSFAGQAPALRVLDFVRAAFDSEHRELLGETRVRLIGLVTEDDRSSHPHAFLLTRFTIGCCAADAIAIQVRVDLGSHEIPPEDAWVEVEGTLDLARSPLATPVPTLPVVVATSVDGTDQPVEVYEYPP